MLLGASLQFANSKPYDSRVEYLESTGTQWIDSGIRVTSDLGFFVRGEMLDRTYNVYPSLVGAQVSDWSVYVNVYQDGGSVFFETHSDDSTRTMFCPAGSIFGGRINYLGDGRMYIDVRTGGAQNNSTCEVPGESLNLGIFCAIDENGPASLSKSRLYHLTITKGAQIVRDFIPVRKDNVGYMYDEVSGLLFGNSGTGEFAYGPDL